MAEYKAKEGKQDRHGEMTGAITFNMILTMLPVMVWSMFIGPWVLGDQITWIVIIALAMAVVLPFVFLRLSQKLWAWMSARMDRF
ncbi:MAG: hypothetical protein WD768_10750 [Phycisphaeraceae bacterium]